MYRTFDGLSFPARVVGAAGRGENSSQIIKKFFDVMDS